MPCHVLERVVFYADHYTMFQNVAQIAKRRSRMSSCTVHGGCEPQTIVAINMTRRARHCAVEC